MVNKLKWSRKECSKLIAALKKHPVLYNKKHPAFLMPDERETAFMYIVGELQDYRPGTFLQEVKDRTKNLRTQYIRERRRIKDAAANGQEVHPKLWCYNEMLFFDDETIPTEAVDLNKVNNSTWQPDIDVDSLSELSYSEFEDAKKNANGNSNESELSLKSDDEIIDDMQISAFDDHQPEEVLEDSSHEHINNEMNSSKKKIPSKRAYKRRNKKPNRQSTYSDPLEASPVKKSLSINRKIQEIEPKLSHLEKTTSEVDELIENNSDSDKAKNRAFVENLLYDLDELSSDILQRVKWQITNEVFAAFNDSNQFKYNPKGQKRRLN